MRCIKQVSKLLLLAQILMQLVESSNLSGLDSDQEDGVSEEEQSSKQQQEGSWSRWWSYDGISGPDYWNINKRWQICSSGRKQSPVDVSTELLIHDHLLGALQLDWLPVGVSVDEAEREISRRLANEASQSHQSSHENRNEASTRTAEEMAEFQKPSVAATTAAVRAQLLNSGRGFEVWLEGGPSFGSKRRIKQTDELAEAPTLHQLILSGGPLSYAYKLFKVELHSSPSNIVVRSRQDAAVSGTRFTSYLSAENQPAAAAAAAAASDSGASRSSEHQIDGRSFDGELQLHFYNKHLADNANQALLMAEQAITSSSSLFAIISVFIIQTTTNRQPTDYENNNNINTNNNNNNNNTSKLDFILNNLQSIPNEADSMELKLANHQIDRLIPDREQYVTYQGSLNRPPCSESVDWILINKPLSIEMDKLQSLFGPSFKTNQENVRPVKALHRRQLRTTINNLSLAARAEVTTDCHRSSFSSSTNCTRLNNNAADRFAGRHRPGGRLKDLQEVSEGRCSMKPKYAYQLSDSFKEL